MKIVFLDFDGVLNSDAFFDAEAKARGGVYYGGRHLDPKAVEVLDEILDRSGALVVISSAWRIRLTLIELKDHLKKSGFRGKVRGVTPVLPKDIRGEEIERWLAENRERYEVESFVILDDCSIYPNKADHEAAPLRDRLVQTEFETGLLPEHIPLALAQLDRPI